MGSLVQRGSCCAEEDFLKSFVPTLFDSDSDAEDTFAQPADLAHGACLPAPHKPLHVGLLCRDIPSCRRILRK